MIYVFLSPSVWEKLQITNISFAEELILFCKEGEGSVDLMMKEFTVFSLATGLVAHPGKCKILFGGVYVKERQSLLWETRGPSNGCNAFILVSWWSKSVVFVTVWKRWNIYSSSVTTLKVYVSELKNIITF